MFDYGLTDNHVFDGMSSFLTGFFLPHSEWVFFILKNKLVENN